MYKIDFSLKLLCSFIFSTFFDLEPKVISNLGPFYSPPYTFFPNESPYNFIAFVYWIRLSCKKAGPGPAVELSERYRSNKISNWKHGSILKVKCPDKFIMKARCNMHACWRYIAYLTFESGVWTPFFGDMLFRSVSNILPGVLDEYYYKNFAHQNPSNVEVVPPNTKSF